MAKSIKLGSDTYLDASGIDGVKGTIMSGDLNDYIGMRYAGIWYIGVTATAITNCPVGYGMLIVGPSIQLAIGKWEMYFRGYTGNPLTWSVWHKVTTTDVS